MLGRTTVKQHVSVKHNCLGLLLVSQSIFGLAEGYYAGIKATDINYVIMLQSATAHVVVVGVHIHV